MLALVEDDLVIGTGTGFVGGVEIPEGIKHEHLRLLGNNIIDASELDSFFIDNEGQKHIADFGNYQVLACHINDEIINEKGVWRVKIDADYDDDIIAEYKYKIDELLERVYTRYTNRNAIYKDKRKEAETYRDEGYPDVTIMSIHFPYLIGEAAENGWTPQEQADLVLSKAATFKDMGVFGHVRIARMEYQVKSAATLQEKIDAADLILGEVVAELNK